MVEEKEICFWGDLNKYRNFLFGFFFIVLEVVFIVGMRIKKEVVIV